MSGRRMSAACDREPLPLPAGDVRAALFDACVEPAGHGPDEVGRLRDFERGPHLVLGGVGLAEQQVAGDGAREEIRPLRNESDRAPQHVGIEVVHVDAADLHRALGAVEQPEDEVDERGLARAGTPDDRGRLTGCGRERDAREHRVLGARSSGSRRCRTRARRARSRRAPGRPAERRSDRCRALPGCDRPTRTHAGSSRS